jgi:CheY-like chemotaxis protein
MTTAMRLVPPITPLKHLRYCRLITLDIDMPEVTGPQFYRKFTKMDDLKDIPVIVISGLAKPHLAVKKAVAVVEKPFDREQLLLLKIVKDTIGE